MKNSTTELTPLIKKGNENTLQRLQEFMEDEQLTTKQQQQQNNRKNYFTYYFMIGCLIILTFLFLFFNFNIMNNKLSNNLMETISVYKNTFTNRYEIIRGRKDLLSDAVGTFQLNIEGGGWNYLEIEATPQDDSMEKYLQSMKAMGYVEGHLTWQQIEQYYPNYYQGMFDTEDPEPVDPDIRVQQYLLENFRWMAEKSKLKCYESAHWLTVRGIVEQLEGLLDGFIDGREEYQKIHGHQSKNDDDDNNNNDNDVTIDDQQQQQQDDKNMNGNIHDNTHLTTLKKPYLLHFLILNGNGDLIQITEKIAAMDEAVKAAEQEETQTTTSTSQQTSSQIHRRTSSSTTTTTKKKDSKEVSRLSLMKSNRSGDHCSAFIKVFPDQSDVVFAHNTWDDYRNMAPRIFKHYIFPPWPIELKKEERKKDTFLKYTAKPTDEETHHHHHKHKKDKKEETEKNNGNNDDDKDHCLCPLTQYSQTIHKDESGANDSYQYHFSPHSYFSSSPGILTSVDDFYTTYTSPNIHIEENKNKNCYCEGPGGRLAIMETSLDVKSPKLYEKIIPESLLSWIRVRSANLIAIDGNDWVSRFSYDHSGTYANQWMVIDFTKFHEFDSTTTKKNNEKVLDEGFLTIVEEMPGMIHSGDETQHILVIIYSLID